MKSIAGRGRRFRRTARFFASRRARRSPAACGAGEPVTVTLMWIRGESSLIAQPLQSGECFDAIHLRRLPMLSRRAVLAGGAAALAASPLVARAQTSPPTVLKIGRAARHRGERQVGLRLRHQSAGRRVRAFHRRRQALPRPGRERPRQTESHPLARADAALAAGWRAGHFRTAHSAGRKRRLRFPADASAARSGCIRIRACRSSC